MIKEYLPVDEESRTKNHLEERELKKNKNNRKKDRYGFDYDEYDYGNGESDNDYNYEYDYGGGGGRGNEKHNRHWPGSSHNRCSKRCCRKCHWYRKLEAASEHDLASNETVGSDASRELKKGKSGKSNKSGKTDFNYDDYDYDYNDDKHGGWNGGWHDGWNHRPRCPRYCCSRYCWWH